MLIVAVEPSPPEYVPIGHNDYFPDVPLVHNEHDGLLDKHLLYEIPSESFIANHEAEEIDGSFETDSQDVENA